MSILSIRSQLPKVSSRRTFFSISPPIQRISASRTLPYPSQDIYDIIAAVPAYSSFLPCCLASSVTKWSKPDAIQGRRWPEQALLEIGWGDLREKFRSNIYCVPGRIVEATGGSTVTRIPREDIAHHDLTGGQSKSKEDEILSHLLSRWTVDSLAPKMTKVALDIEFQFANPVYAAMSSAVAGRVADIMIEAFEKRVEKELARGAVETRAAMDAALKGL
jgi:coenzyme Q-binding protein COQ10